MQLGDDKKLFEFIYVKSASETHVLAAKALLRSDAARSGREGPKVHDLEVGSQPQNVWKGPRPRAVDELSGEKSRCWQECFPQY